MAQKRLLLLSNSKNYAEAYLEHATTAIKDFLGGKIERALFVPYAGVRTSLDDYVTLVRWRFDEMGYHLDSVHEADDLKLAASKAEALVIGGGNTFHLLYHVYKAGLLDIIRERVNEGVPYIGWSAGANIACPTIGTTNDMPITEPPSFAALGFVPFQINPHYTDAHPVDHQGETRAERLAEFIEVNPGLYVVGLREGSILRIEGSSVKLLGGKSAKIFVRGKEPFECAPEQSLEFLLS